LGGPDRGRMSSHSEQMDPAGAYLHHEQNIESVQGDGVEGEEIGGQQARGLSPKEGPPPCVCSTTGCRAESGGGQDPPDRASAYAVAEPGEFSLDSAMAPGGVLLGLWGSKGRPALLTWVIGCSAA
jgi:hypothetical protein